MISKTKWNKTMSNDNGGNKTKEDKQRVFFQAVKDGKIKTPEFIIWKSKQKALIAQYTDFTKANPYSNSIFAQALPPYLSEDEFIKYANYFPNYFTEEVRKLTSPEKHDRATTVDKLFRVTNKNIEVFQKISSAIRRSYTDKVHDGEHQNSRGGIVIYGISSEGKTFAVNFSLSYFYQFIVHLKTRSNYKNSAQPDMDFVIQVTWLKIICPSNGGPISLCNNILSAVDALIGSDYEKSFKSSYGHRTELDLKIYINRVKQVIKDIHLGVLVIDEIQFIAHGESKQQLADFLVELSDEIGIPIIVIGTLEVISAFSELSFSFKSKLTKDNEVYFEPFEPVNGKAPKGYRSLIRLLFKKYQIGNHPIPIELFDEQEKVLSTATEQAKVESISDVFFHETAGITLYTINLFILLQQHINLLEDKAKRNARKAKDQNKKPTPPKTKSVNEIKTLIKKTAKQSFQINRKYLNAIIRGDKESLQKMKDVDFREFRRKDASKKFQPSVDIEEAQEQYEKNVEIPSKLKTTLDTYGISEKIADEAIKAVMDGYNDETEFELITKAMDLCKKMVEKPDKPIRLSPHIERADIDLGKVQDELEM